MEVFEYFGLKEDSTSIYKYAPVYEHMIDNRRVIIKKTKEQADRLVPLQTWQEKLIQGGVKTIYPVIFKNKLHHAIGEENWVIYPFIEGERYEATREQIYGAGELLGRVHSTSDAVFNHGFLWGNYDDEFYEDVFDDIKVISERYPDEFNSEEGKALFENIKSSASSKFEYLTKLELPTSDCTWDYKASNLLYQKSDLYLIDTDNAAKVPRIFDLSLALLLFHTTVDSAPNRVFTTEEWELFLSGYKKHIRITDIEKRCWQRMLLFVYTDEVLWAINDLEDDEDDRQKDFIRSLVTFRFSEYTVG